MAFLLVIAIFSFWSVVGFALTSTLRTQRNLLQNVLLAPSTGLAATVLLIVWTNFLNVPIRYGGPAVTLLLLATSAYLLRRSPVKFPARRIMPFWAALLLSALIVGYPLFVYGFNWLSYGNGDMANYCLGAKFFLNHGEFSPPRIADYVSDSDASAVYWFFYIVHSLRHGVEELLAWTLSLTGLSAHQAFMPLILSFNLTLISSTGALVMQHRRYRSAALLTCFALALSPLTTLGTEYQLLGQVAGLAMLASASTVLLFPMTLRMPQLLLTALQLAGAATVYPEIIPFLGLSFLLYHSVSLVRGCERLRTFLKALGITAVCTAVLLNAGIFVLISTLLTQTAAGTRSSNLIGSQFPYYLTPEAFAYLWGFLAIGQFKPVRVVDIEVVFGLLLFASAVAVSVWYTWTRKPVACCFLVMAVVAFWLFGLRSDFGLYKLAMYIQPFLLGTMSVAFASTLNRWRGLTSRIPLATLACMIAGSGLASQLRYVNASLGLSGGGLAGIPLASSKGLISALKRIGNKGPHAPTLSTTTNTALARIIAYYDNPIYFAAQDALAVISPASSGLRWSPYTLMFGRVQRDFFLQRQARFYRGEFDMHGWLPANGFLMRKEIVARNVFPVIEEGMPEGVINRRRGALTSDAIRLVPADSLSNYLMFVMSDMGGPSDAVAAYRARGRVSFYQLEPDYFFPGQTMSSIGRISLFSVLNPSGHLRMILEYSASLNADGKNAIPEISVIGNQRLRFEAMGRGSARLISPVIDPQNIHNGAYVSLDMGTWGQRFPQRQSWITSLWGTNVLEDSRLITGFARDVSLISDEEYQAMTAPNVIQHFPDDLKDKNLEYSGIYEDGWIAESSYAMLNEPEDAPILAVQLSIPVLHGVRPSGATLLVDGKVVASESTSTGSVSFKVRVPGHGRRRIGLRFDRAAGLPAPDNRPVSAQLLYMGFKPTELQAREK